MRGKECLFLHLGKMVGFRCGLLCKIKNYLEKTETKNGN